MGKLAQITAPLILMISGCASTVPVEKHEAVVKELQKTRDKLRGAENARDGLQTYLQEKLPQAIKSRNAIQKAHQKLAHDYAQKHHEAETLHDRNQALLKVIITERRQFARFLYIVFRAEQYRHEKEQLKLKKEVLRPELKDSSQALQSKKKDRDF